MVSPELEDPTPLAKLGSSKIWPKCYNHYTIQVLGTKVGKVSVENHNQLFITK